MTNRRIACPGLIAAAWLLVVAPAATAAPGDPVKGKAVYEQRCLACHGPQGRGDGPTGKVLVPPAADFTSAASKKKSDADLLKIIENGKPPTAMVAWKGQLSDQDIQHVLAYVKTLRK
jgi:mono/diheme cytochrome c family protein